MASGPNHIRQLQKKVKDFFFANLVFCVLGALLVTCVAVGLVVYHLEHSVESSNIKSVGDGLWWGVVTALTVGYGDRYPITGEGRLIAVVLMAMGVLSTAIMTSKISTFFLEKVLREGRNIVDTKKLKDHFVICGWKEDMTQLLTHILDFNPGLTAERVVLIANLEQSVIDSMRDQPRMKGLQVIVGDYFQDESLRRAAPERARKVLILADRTPKSDGQQATPTEVDARTIMTAMTLANIARGTLVAAEVLDPKMDQYLKLAHVSEIIYTREYSRLLLGNASAGTGLSNIIFDLLDPRTTTKLATQAIDEKFFGGSYSAFKTALESRTPGSVVIGILENTGNQTRIKENALREAQKTPDVARLVQNLRAVKEIRCNLPVFNPPADYVIHQGSMAIVVENRIRTASEETHGSAENHAA